MRALFGPAGNEGLVVFTTALLAFASAAQNRTAEGPT